MKERPGSYFSSQRKVSSASERRIRHPVHGNEAVMSVIQKVFGTHSEREIKRIAGLVDKIESLRHGMMEL